MNANFVSKTITEAGLSAIAQAANVYPSAVHKWKVNGRLPLTELTGLTNYSTIIERLTRPGVRDQLLVVTRAAWEKSPPKKRGRA